MAFSATLHCLVGCSIGEVLGLIIGTITHLATGQTVVLSIVLAFIFGFTLSILPLVRSGIRPTIAARTVVAADTLSIATMELVDNAVMLAIPGAMNAGLVNPLFWITMPLSLTVAFCAAYPVNRYLISKGKGHALTMRHLGEAHHH